MSSNELEFVLLSSLQNVRFKFVVAIAATCILLPNEYGLWLRMSCSNCSSFVFNDVYVKFKTGFSSSSSSSSDSSVSISSLAWTITAKSWSFELKNLSFFNGELVIISSRFAADLADTVVKFISLNDLLELIGTSSSIAELTRLLVVKSFKNKSNDCGIGFEKRLVSSSHSNTLEFSFIILSSSLNNLIL